MVKKSSDFKNYKKEIMDAAHNDRLRLAFSRAVKSFRGNVKNALEKFPHTVALADEVRVIKEKAIPDMEKLARQAIAAIEENKGKGYIARTAEEALEIISGLVGTKKLIVKGKSMTGEEIGLREHLEEIGNEVYETDLGEFIIQKMGVAPDAYSFPLHPRPPRGCRPPFLQNYGTGNRPGRGNRGHGGGGA